MQNAVPVGEGMMIAVLGIDLFQLNDLIKNKQIEIDYVANLVPRLFCRKLYNYSYEVVDEF